MASVIPKELKRGITDAWAAATVKVALLVAYAFVDGHNLYANVSGWEHPAGSGYTTGGELLTDSSAYSGLNAIYSAATKSWTGVTITGANFAVIYNTTTGAIIALLDLTGSWSVVNGTFTLQWNLANGIVKVS